MPVKVFPVRTDWWGKEAASSPMLEPLMEQNEKKQRAHRTHGLPSCLPSDMCRMSPHMMEGLEYLKP